MGRGTVLTRSGLVLVLVAVASLAGVPPAAQRHSVVDLLDRYAAGKFDAVANEMTGPVDFNDILGQLRRDGPAWLAGGPPDARAKRELAAATFALEAARAGAWTEWKVVQKQPQVWGLQVLNVLYWKPPPLLIEWGCVLLSQRPEPHPAERWWHLAAVAVAQRSEDPQFLVGDPNIGRGAGAGEIGNRNDEIKHLDHATKRFPKEMRFLLAQGIARDRVWPDDAVMTYRALEHDPDVGGEALMRLGAMQVRLRRTGDALVNFERALAKTRDPYVAYLAWYFTGQALERDGEIEDAREAYERAVAVVPHAQSATLALAALVFRDGRRAEAQRLVRGMLAAEPPPVDPWRAFVHADDRFWPMLIGRLRAEIAR